MNSRDNKQLIRRLHESGYPDGPDALDRFFDKGLIDHSGWGDRESLKAALGAFHEAYPSARWTLEDMIGEGDKIAARAKIEIMSASGVAKTIGITTVYRIANGKIVEQWGHSDPLF